MLNLYAQTFSSFVVNLGGRDLAIIPIATDVNYIVYGANINPSDAGQLKALTITALAGPNTTDYFDSFAFSSSQIPEPSTGDFFALGSVLLGIFCHRKGKMLIHVVDPSASPARDERA